MAKRTNRLSPKKIDEAQRRRQAVGLRVAGWTFERIAEMCGYANPSAAFNAVDKELREAGQEEVDTLRSVEKRRIEKIINKLWPQLIGGNTSPVTLDAIKVYLQLSARLARLLGLDVAAAGGGGATATSSVTLVQIGTSQPKALGDLSDEELLAYVGHLERKEIIEGEVKVLPSGGDGDGKG